MTATYRHRKCLGSVSEGSRRVDHDGSLLAPPLDDEVERVPLVGLQVLRRLEPERGERAQHLLV